jgi:hypothetical protein
MVADIRCENMPPECHYAAVVLCEQGDATDEEIQLGLEMSGSTERPRRVELVAAGRIVDSGRTRPTQSGRQAVVWETL